MSDVRNIISSLCVVLNKVLDEEIRAEHFRLAKFNKSEKSNINHIWNILHKLCCPSFQQNFSEAGKCKGNNKDVVLCVKLCFHSHQYDCFSFYCLTSDMITGSRELLLAFGWLLGETNALEIKLWSYIKNNMFKGPSSQQCLEDRLSTYTHATPDTIKSTGDIFNHIIWLAGKIKHNFKSIFNSTSEKMSMNSKVQSQTKGALNLPYLSVEQIMLLKDSNSTYAVPENVLKDTKSVLENYFYFVKKEHVFWSWMESVILEDRKNTIEANKNNVDYCKFMDAVKTEVKHEILEETSDKYNKLDTEIISHNNYNGNDNDVSQNTLLEINKDVERLNNLFKNKVNEVNGLLERLKIDCSSSADSE